MNTVLITMAGMALTGMILEKILIVSGKIDIAQMVNIAVICLGAGTVITLIVDLFVKLRALG